ncbi:MAG: phage holin family protein [Acidimicrobiia bacterium]
MADEGDWASETADKLEQLVDKVRSQTTDRLVSIARIVVFGLLAAIMGIMAAVLGLAAAVHFLDEMIPQEVWLTYLIVGAIFTGVGLFLWSKKDRRPSEAQ